LSASDYIERATRNSAARRWPSARDFRRDCRRRAELALLRRTSTTPHASLISGPTLGRRHHLLLLLLLIATCRQSCRTRRSCIREALGTAEKGRSAERWNPDSTPARRPPSQNTFISAMRSARSPS